MNVKLKRPKVGQSIKGNRMLREMAMTIVATTISIVLTFGTGMWIDKRKEKQDGRQMAMMVVSDIDMNVEFFQELARDEERQYELTRYVERHMDQIEQISSDTILEVWSYLTEGDIYSPDESKERIFNSSQQTWKNIDNAQFINIVQAFYQSRRLYDEHFEREMGWRAPVSREDFYRLMTSEASWDIGELIDLLKELIPTRPVQVYLEFSNNRSRTIYNAANSWQQMSDQCKFIMSITDDELQEYLNKQKRSGSPVTERQLIGTWTARASLDNREESIEFRRDHTFVHRVDQYRSKDIFTGRIIIRRTMEGTWRLKGDSLFRDYDSDSYALDRNDVQCTEDMKDSLEKLITEYTEIINKRNEQEKQQGLTGQQRSNTAFIDRSGRKIELGKTTLDEDGNEELSTSYMVKAQK